MQYLAAAATVISATLEHPFKTRDFNDGSDFSILAICLSGSLLSPLSSRCNNPDPTAAIADIVVSFKSGRSFVKTMEGPLRKNCS